MTISLIQTSQNRRDDLLRFMESLNKQVGLAFSEIQLIFVDQERNRDLFDSLNQDIEFTYISTDHCSLSHARNLAIPYVKGKFVAFPDDDCWYEPDTLAKALKVLEGGEYDGDFYAPDPECHGSPYPVNICSGQPSSST